MTARYIVGDVLEVLRSMPDASVDLALSSPPFLALRSYLPADHPDKAKEIGSEPTPGAFIDTLLDVVEECRRVLAPHGSLCFELGDTYAGSGGAGGDYAENGLREGQAMFDGSKARRWPQGRDWGPSETNPSSRKTPPGWPLDKSLCLVPELLRIAMVYGVNPLTGRATPRWRARNVVRWCRPNPPVGALGDKVRPATSDILVACVDRKRYFDLDAIRTPHSVPAEAMRQNNSKVKPYPGGGGDMTNPSMGPGNPAGAPPLDHWWFDEVDDLFPQDAWHVSTEPYKGSHYATWPTDLCVRPILAMCPQRVCTTCGKPSERIVSIDHVANRATNGPQSIEKRHVNGGSAGYSVRADRHSLTTGWTDCGHGTWRQGVVLDPFAGSGTTLLVALGHGRSAVGIDLDARNADLARARVGMWLDVETHVPIEQEVPA
jgi:site-specific DNA-methyltransferase (adenine-specific)